MQVTICRKLLKVKQLDWSWNNITASTLINDPKHLSRVAFELDNKRYFCLKRKLVRWKVQDAFRPLTKYYFRKQDFVKGEKKFGQPTLSWTQQESEMWKWQQRTGPMKWGNCSVKSRSCLIVHIDPLDIWFKCLAFADIYMYHTYVQLRKIIFVA